METVSMYTIDVARSHAPTPGYLVWRLAMHWRAAVDAAVAPLGLTHALYVVLASLRGIARDGSTPSQRELADHTGLDKIYISKLARTLEQAGYIARDANPDDPRAFRLRVTSDGRRVIDHGIEIVRQLQDNLIAPLGGLSSQRAKRLMNDLQLLVNASSSASSSATNSTDGKES
jgi:MarR family transcriptional regulator, organic hydroperoxide resistance regulator